MRTAARDFCEIAESGLAKAGQLLLEPSPASMEECLETLSKVIETLEDLASNQPADWDQSAKIAACRIEAAARNLRVRIDYGANLVRGWRQLRLGEGYTKSGQPQFTEPDNGRHLEV